eukprot:Sspe_Gene.57049::Locus_31328_Transcript_1_2_Confidence_0.667_Length_1363::g.57049::m.57049
MTTGRFESRVHTLPMHRDTLPHWSTWKRSLDFPFRKFSEETRYKESCPFHDLRAEGQFQPETWGPHDPIQANIDDYLTRKGPGFRTGLNRNNRMGCSGGPVALDPTPNPPQNNLRCDPPWTSTSKPKYFSVPPYQPCPDPEPRKPLPPGGHFKAGKVAPKHSDYPYVSEKRGKLTPRKPFRLACGKAPDFFDPNVHKGERPIAVERPRRREEGIAKMTTNLRAPLQGTFGRYPKYMSDAYDDCPVKPRGDDSGRYQRKLKPIYTWATKTKRSMPINAPWGVQPAAPDATRVTTDLTNPLDSTALKSFTFASRPDGLGPPNAASGRPATQQ